MAGLALLVHPVVITLPADALKPNPHLQSRQRLPHFLLQRRASHFSPLPRPQHAQNPIIVNHGLANIENAGPGVGQPTGNSRSDAWLVVTEHVNQQNIFHTDSLIETPPAASADKSDSDG